MIYIVCSVYDVKVKTYGRPVVARTAGEAIRVFQAECSDANSYLFRNPEDFTLFKLAVFDDETGRVESIPAPDPIAKAIQFKEVK